jgi:S1/P1 Nuclease
MKKLFLSFAALLFALVLVSWGEKGHRAVGQIAENHLTDKAKLAVKHLLGNETLADVSNYADEMRSDRAYKYTGAWHYVNVPIGYNFEQFSHAVRTMQEDNVYKMVLSCEKDLKDPSKSRTAKAFALKIIVHLIGDLHQPMHVSRAEDKGGNDIAIKFSGSADNLHGLWDCGLIDRERLSYKQMATDYDDANPATIKKWQEDSLMVWLWESYQISTILYQEIEKDPNIDEAYYQSHLPVLHKRIEKAGIRLAGVLNAIFDPAI